MTNARIRKAAAVVAALLVLLVACAGRSPQAESSEGASRAAFRQLHDSRFVWVEAQCSDGPLDLGQLGFERDLTVGVEKGTLLLTLETAIPTSACRSTAVWLVEPAAEVELWRYEPQTVVVLPAGAPCGATEKTPALGTLRLDGEVLEVVTQSSPWCRGFDARFVYRRARPKLLEPEQLATRYVAHFDRGDSASVASLFESSGSLVEPFTRTDDGNYKRHEGRERIQEWFASAFASTSWHALRLLALAPGAAPDQVIAEWEYMDEHLAEPLRGRNLFVVAAGEVYESEVQLTGDPKPAARLQPAPAPASKP